MKVTFMGNWSDSLSQGEADKFISAGLQKVLDVFLSVGGRRKELTAWGVSLGFIKLGLGQNCYQQTAA